MRQSFIVAAALLTCAVPALAQDSAPPAVIAIAREEIPPGRMPAHERNAASFVALLNRAGATNYRMGLSPLSGDDNQVIYVEPYGSFEEVEQARQQFDQALASNAGLRTELDQLTRENTPLHNSQRTMFARYRADLSYRPRTREEWARARFMSVITTRLKPGRAPDYVEYVKQLNAARTTANIRDHLTVYQVVTGAPSVGTFLTFTSLKALKEWDEFFGRSDQDQKAIEQALGGPVVVERRRQLLSDTVIESQHNLFAIDPALSRPTPQMVAADPEFWTPKPAEASGKALAVKKKTPDDKPKP